MPLALVASNTSTRRYWDMPNAATCREWGYIGCVAGIADGSGGKSENDDGATSEQIIDWDVQEDMQHLPPSDFQ